MTLIYAVILFVVLIFPHELGHFIVAKAVGVKVNEFAFGMGPALFKHQKGETLYAIRLIPIGGYCAMEGENEESENSRAFNNKPGWAKVAVLLSGSAMNVVIAILVLSLLMGVTGVATTSIDEITSGSPAYEAGLEKGDQIVSINDKKIQSWSDLTSSISTSKEDLSIEINRNGIEKEIRVTPTKNSDGRYVIGIKPEVTHNVFVAAKEGVKASWNLTVSMFDSLKQLITGKVSTDQITGPVGMISMVSDTNQYGLGYFGYLLALISLNLAIINMLPLPALDGGRILFVIIRKITGKMISDDLEGKIHAAGLVLLLGLMVFVTWNDIMRLIS